MKSLKQYRDSVNLCNIETITGYKYSSMLPTTISTDFVINEFNSNNFSYSVNSANYLLGLTNNMILKPNTSYTLSFNRTSTGANSERFYVYDVSQNGTYTLNTSIIGTGVITRKFTTNEIGIIAFGIGVDNVSNGVTGTVEEIMLVEGEIEHEYEPYGKIFIKDGFETFKQSINANGKQIIASFDILGVPYPSELIVKVNPYFDSANSLLGSTMKCLEIEVQGLLPVMIDTQINNLKFGVKSDGEYDYVNFGTYIVNKYEWDIENMSTTLLCYDKMVESMIPYDLGIDYSTGNVKILDLLQNICNRLGWTLGTTEFTNSNVIIDEEKFDNTYTFRSVLEEIGQVAGGKIAFKDDDILYVLYPTETNETIDESNLKTLTIGKKYGPVNSLVIARTPQEDNIYRQDEDMINGPGGKNKFNLNKLQWTAGSNSPTLTKHGDNSCTVSASNPSGYMFTRADITKFLEVGKTYVASCTNTNTAFASFVFDEYNGSTRTQSGKKIITILDGYTYYIKIYINRNGTEYTGDLSITYTNMQIEEGDTGTEFEEFTPQGVIEVKIENNQLMDSHREDFIDNLFSRLKGLSFYTYELESYGIGYLELYDLFTMKTHDDKEYSCLFLYDNLEITQGLSENSKAELPEETETNYKVASESDRVLNKTILQVDKQDQEIRALITSTQNISGEMDGIKDGYNSLTQQVEQTMTSTQIQTLITETISNGVDSVTTSTGYTFNKDGLIISKTGEEMENKIDNTGMYVNRDNENILTANNEGVNAINLTARQYLTIGNNSRLEDYKTNRTACFYVGGDN